MGDIMGGRLHVVERWGRLSEDGGVDRRQSPWLQRVAQVADREASSGPWGFGHMSEVVKRSFMTCLGRLIVLPLLMRLERLLREIWPLSTASTPHVVVCHDCRCAKVLGKRRALSLRFAKLSDMLRAATLPGVLPLGDRRS